MTSIWPVKSRVKKVIDYARNPEKTKEESLERLADFHQIDGVLEYAADDMKTEERSYVTCIGCREETAAEQFMETKRTWSAVSGMDKSLGRVCYHGYQSFAKGEVTAEMAHEIGVKLAQRLWGDRYEVLVATHCNTDHYHNHFVINSVSHVDGIKFRNTHADYRAMREASDRLCLEYGISMIEEPERRGKNYGEYLAEANGKPTVRSFIRNDIDAAIRSSITVREFIGHLSVMGYEMKFYNEKGKELKYPALKPMGAKGFFRFHNLGQGYSLEEIKERIQRNKRRVLPFPEEEKEAARRYRLSNPPRRKLSGLKALYYRYCYELGILKRYPASAKRVPFSMKEDVIKLERLSRQSQLLAEQNIETMEDLAQFQAENRKNLEALEEQRRILRNELKRALRASQEEEAERIKARIAHTSSQIKLIREAHALTQDIRERSVIISDSIEAVSSGQNTNEGKEVNQNEQLFGGRSRAGGSDVPGGNRNGGEAGR